MKAKKITYSRLISKGNYENAKIEIEMEVEDGEKAVDVLRAAKRFVNNAIEAEKISERERDRMVEQNIENLQQLQKAQMNENDELPF